MRKPGPSLLRGGALRSLAKDRRLRLRADLHRRGLQTLREPRPSMLRQGHLLLLGWAVLREGPGHVQRRVRPALAAWRGPPACKPMLLGGAAGWERQGALPVHLGDNALVRRRVLPVLSHCLPLSPRGPAPRARRLGPLGIRSCTPTACARRGLSGTVFFWTPVQGDTSPSQCRATRS